MRWLPKEYRGENISARCAALPKKRFSVAPNSFFVMLENLFNPNAVAGIVLVYALVIAAGLFLGRIKFFGISLGSTFVLFVGLAAGHFGLSVNPNVLGFLRDFGLMVFIFFIGLQVGPSFFSSFRSGGLLLNGLMGAAVLLSVLLPVLFWALLPEGPGLPSLIGMYYGAVTNTPGLGAAQELLSAMGAESATLAVAYACAYPLGVVGIIASAVIIRKCFRIDLAEEDRQWAQEESESAHASVVFHVEVKNASLPGMSIEHVRRIIGRPFVCSRLRIPTGETVSPGPNTTLEAGDVLRIVAQPEHKDAVIAFFGGPAEGVDLSSEHSPIQKRLIVVTAPAMNGVRIGDLHLSDYDGLNATRVFRAGMELFPYQRLHLQLGDRLLVVGPERAVGRLAERLGNKIEHLDHPNIAAVFIGLALGILLGSLPIALPGIPVPIKLGLAGGPLIVAILLGRYGANMRLATYATNSANLMMREIGMSFFLASIGLSAGGGFAAAFSEGSGWLFMGLGLIVTMAPLLIVGVVARKCFAMNYHSIVGLMAGATTDPPALAYAGALSEKNSSAVAYSTVYPLAMFLRILSGQIVLLIFWSAAS